MKNNGIIYISGKITGLDEDECLASFAQAEKKMAGEGFSVINPTTGRYAHMAREGKILYRDMLTHCIILLSRCTHIYMLKNYKRSPGALAELAFAKAADITVIYE